MNITCIFQKDLPNIDWVAVSALFVAIISLVTTIRVSRKTVKLTEEHNKKSVEPFLTDHYMNMTEVLPLEKRYQSYNIKNCGPGPAIIKSLTYKFEDLTFTNIQTFHNEFFLKIKSNSIMRHFYIGSTHVLSSNETIELFNISCESEDGMKKLLELNHKVGIQIEYESIYKIEKKFQKDNLY